jgi:hypothetical protein
MPQYYYILCKPTKSALCFGSLKEAKKVALEKKSLIYRAKNELPDWVEKVEGFCMPTLRRANGKFSKKFSEKFFNIDMKSVDN